jgi:hypothetical protein
MYRFSFQFILSIILLTYMLESKMSTCLEGIVIQFNLVYPHSLTHFSQGLVSCNFQAHWRQTRVVRLFSPSSTLLVLEMWVYLTNLNLSFVLQSVWIDVWCLLFFSLLKMLNTYFCQMGHLQEHRLCLWVNCCAAFRIVIAVCSSHIR